MVRRPSGWDAVESKLRGVEAQLRLLRAARGGSKVSLPKSRGSKPRFTGECFS